MAATMNNAWPENALSAQYSIPHALASYLLLRETGTSAYSEAAVRDPKMRSLRRRVIVRNDLGMDGRTPFERPAAVRLELRNGQVRERCVRLPEGEFGINPLSDGEIKEKFRKLASRCLASKTAEALLSRLWRIETVLDIKELTSLCRGE
jgi:2-methylcitrate dehydratase